MHKCFTPNVNGVEGESYFVKSRVVGNYEKLFEKCKQL